MFKSLINNILQFNQQLHFLANQLLIDFARCCVFLD